MGVGGRTETVPFIRVNGRGVAAALQERSGSRRVEVGGAGSSFGSWWPVAGRVTSPFGWRRDPILERRAFHSGIDVGAPLGEYVYAVRGGRVARVATGDRYGCFVILEHCAGVLTVYAHLASIEVKPGDHVPGKAALGTVGLTGRTTGPHLHFELRRHGRAVDPMRWLEQQVRSRHRLRPVV